MRIERHYTKAGQDAYAGIDFRTAVSEIKNPDGSIVFRLDGIEVPSVSYTHLTLPTILRV